MLLRLRVIRQFTALRMRWASRSGATVAVESAAGTVAAGSPAQWSRAGLWKGQRRLEVSRDARAVMAAARRKGLLRFLSRTKDEGR